MIEYAKRDRRWCQGNLQHGRLILAPHFNLWNRVSMVVGIMAYAASPIWLMFIIVSLLDPIIAADPDYFPADSLFPVFPTPETGKALLLLFGIFLLLLLPKTLIAFSTAFSERRRAFGSTLGVLAGATVELALTSVLAPVMMMFQSKSVAEILFRLDAGWPSTDRDDGSLPLGLAFRSSWWMVIFGLVLTVATLSYSPELFLWMLPIAGPLLVAPVLISLTGNPALGVALRRRGILSTPFEIAPEPVIRAAETWRRRFEAISGRMAADTAAPEKAPAGLKAQPA